MSSEFIVCHGIGPNQIASVVSMVPGCRRHTYGDGDIYDIGPGGDVDDGGVAERVMVAAETIGVRSAGREKPGAGNRHFLGTRSGVLHCGEVSHLTADNL